MIADVMLDTNIVAYAASHLPEDLAKKTIAVRLIAAEQIGLSGQVLQEFYVTVTRKMKTPLNHHEALDWLEELEQFPCIPVDSSIVYQGAENARNYQISYWDGAIIAAAHRLGAHTLYSEDLNHGQKYGSVTVINPFKAA